MTGRRIEPAVETENIVPLLDSLVFVSITYNHSELVSSNTYFS
jgi:hypothetical protein